MGGVHGKEAGGIGMNAVVMNHLSKIYAGGKTAVADMDLSLEQGEVFGFLGPNGA